MELKEYFAGTKGYAVLATADSSGTVDLALYSRPHFMDDGSIGFIMADRLTHHNLETNPHAAYLFIEAGEGYNGKRFLLTKTGESTDASLIEETRKKSGYTDREYGDQLKYLVFFKIDKELPLT